MKDVEDMMKMMKYFFIGVLVFFITMFLVMFFYRRSQLNTLADIKMREDENLSRKQAKALAALQIEAANPRIMVRG